jgi:hypothetical protein
MSLVRPPTVNGSSTWPTSVVRLQSVSFTWPAFDFVSFRPMLDPILSPIGPMTVQEALGSCSVFNL